MSWFSGARTRLHLLLGRRAAESRIDDEIRFHIEMETQRLEREQHLAHDEAKRRALATFGGVQQHRETLRDGRGTAAFSGLSLDLKLGFRMLVKYPGLTIIGGLAMAFGIWFGAVTFQMFGMLTGTKLPLPDGDRIVRIQSWDAKTLQEEDRVLYDYQLWRSARSVTDLGAYRDASVNVQGTDGAAMPERAAEVTASAFRIAPARPLFGRVLAESDESAGAAPVVLLGHDVWTKRFNADPRIVGRNVKIGKSFATVVGVMPEGYRFPIAHEMWLPLRTNVAGVEPLRGSAIKVFGRLASGMSIENAQAELTALGERLAAQHPATHAQLQAHVLPYTKLSVGDDMSIIKGLTYFFVVVLVMVVCSTVALLFFARAAARQTELLVRSALGASRKRIVTQLFAEALVLAGVAAVVGLAMAQLAMTRLGQPYLERAYDNAPLPFWLNFNLSATTIIYALVLALIGAVVAGVMPARKITRGLGTQLRAGTSGGGGVSFGGVWTAVIVTQVAFTVALPAVVMLVRSESNRVKAYDFGFPAQQYLGVTLGVDDATTETLTPEARAAQDAQLSSSLEMLRARLQAEPGVLGVTFVDKFPGGDHVFKRAELVSLPGTAPSWVSTASIDPSYFDVLKAPVRAGRGFSRADLSADAHVVIVDQAFVDLVMSGRNPIGHRVRLTDSSKPDSNTARLPWYEIVGVVKDLGMESAAMPQRWPGLYLPVVPGNAGAINMLVHSRGDALAMVPHVRELATAVDASLRVEKVTRLDQVATATLWLTDLWMTIILGLTTVALVLSLAGIYAVLAYIVARRTREIGVRVALGASARRVVTSIFRRPLIQVTLGVMAGSVLIAFAAAVAGNTEQFRGTDVGALTPFELVLLVGYAILMLGVCTLACVVPTVRALKVQPTEALRAE